ncbi:hypothetical protein [Streptomyces sp. NBC_01435]|uniref:hypothetical protein n=1 Tax=Streptomyces sp. NBC_01435 TaxID=2903865 RepID=UPI002E379CF2|nr:hypothetical protein [Streptomyces sp. NBC_01435]
MGQYTEQMMAVVVDRERARLIQEALDIADAATRFAHNVDSGIACGDADPIAQAAQKLALRANRVAVIREIEDLHTAERNIINE